MHSKYVVFDEKIVWPGSYNFTVKANTKNQENVVIIYDKKVAREFEKNYWYLRNLSAPRGKFEDLLDVHLKETPLCRKFIISVLCLCGICSIIYSVTQMNPN